VDCEGIEAWAAQCRLGLYRKQAGRRLGLPVGDPWIVFATLEADVVKLDSCSLVGNRAQAD